MLVPSTTFLIFAALAALIFNLGPELWWRRTVLLVVNVVFLATFAHKAVEFLPFAAFLSLGFVAQRVTRNGSAPRLFWAMLVVTVAAFFWLKRYS